MLLVVLRFVQGLGVGGEWGGAVLMVVEHGARPAARVLAAAGPQAGVPAGLLLADGRRSACVASCPRTQFLAWGWRVPFLLGVVLTGVGLFIRLQVLESPLFDASVRASRPHGRPLLEVVRGIPRNVLLAMGAASPRTGSLLLHRVRPELRDPASSALPRDDDALTACCSPARRQPARHPAVRRAVRPRRPPAGLPGGALFLAASPSRSSGWWTRGDRRRCGWRSSSA